MNWMATLQACFEVDSVYYTRHARIEMETEAFGPILDEEVHQAILTGEVVREYPDDTPYPSVLLFGRTARNRPLHLVCAYDAGEDRAIIVTAYQPDVLKWIDYKTRRTT